MGVSYKPINAIIVDDEHKACSNLKEILREYCGDDINIVGVAHNTRDAEAEIGYLKPHAIFLDIQMPKENAFHFLERIAPFEFEVIFVTAYDEYAVKAFKLNAVDYILKPIDIDEIISAVQKLKERLQFRSVVNDYRGSFTELAQQVSSTAKYSKITFRSVSGSEIVDFNDIYYLEAQSSYSKIVFKQDNYVRELIMSSPLSDYEELLPVNIFFRIHKSYLVNCNYINRIINGETNYIVLNNEYTLAVSRRRFIPLKRFLKKHTNYKE